MAWKIDDPQGNEAAKIKWELVPYTRGMGLDLGCGPSKPFPHFIGVDSRVDTQLFGIQMQPDITVKTCESLPMFATASMDFVFSSHLLEHIRYESVPGTLAEWMRVIKPGGHLCLYLPDEDQYPKVGEPGANPDHKWNVNFDRVIEAMPDGFDLIRFEKRSEGYEYSLFFVFKKAEGRAFSHRDYKRPEKAAAVVRYGAFGDLIQASTVFHALKDEGFHVTLYTTPKGLSVVQHDPHIDALVIQDTDQVPNHELGDFWKHEQKKYDRWVQLSESVEGSLLTLPGRTSHTWPESVKRKYLNTNYFEFVHDLAEVSAPIRPKFYATDLERAWAKKERESFGGSLLIMYVLAGSSVHKVWPHMDLLFARIFKTYPSVRILTVGDEAAKIIEGGWEDEPRVLRRAGVYSIRETLALLDQCDMVIGPETGVLNAAGHLPMPKIVFLSHSSANNLTKHWKNTIALGANTVSCHPCHQMIYSWDQCRRHETGTSECMHEIGIERVWNQVTRLLKKAA